MTDRRPQLVTFHWERWQRILDDLMAECWAEWAVKNWRAGELPTMGRWPK